MSKQFLANLTTKASVIAGKAGLQLSKHSPEILMGVGAVSFVATVVVAVKQTPKYELVLNNHRADLDDIAKAIEVSEPEEYTEKDIRRDKFVVYTKTAVSTVKVYAPVMALGALSLACMLSANHILKKRYIGAVAAYNALSGAFEAYRERVKERFGEDVEKEIRYGVKTAEIDKITVDENGKKQKDKETVTYKDGEDPTQVIFQEGNPNWERNRTFNVAFLNGSQNMFNDKLKTRGHVFLNEVYDHLGFKHTPEGAVTGWLLGSGGDDYIDFRPCECRDGSFILSFNHDGIIFDKLGKKQNYLAS